MEASLLQDLPATGGRRPHRLKRIPRSLVLAFRRWRADIKQKVEHVLVKSRASKWQATVNASLLRAAEQELVEAQQQRRALQEQLEATQRQLLATQKQLEATQLLGMPVPGSAPVAEKKPAKRRAAQQVSSAAVAEKPAKRRAAQQVPGAAVAENTRVKRNRRGRAASTPVQAAAQASTPVQASAPVQPAAQAPAVSMSPEYAPRSPEYQHGPSTPDYPPPSGSTGLMYYVPPSSPDFPPPDSFNSPNYTPADTPGTPGGQYYTGERWDDRDR